MGASLRELTPQELRSWGEASKKVLAALSSLEAFPNLAFAAQGSKLLIDAAGTGSFGYPRP
jgi:hypothetical protein